MVSNVSVGTYVFSETREDSQKEELKQMMTALRESGNPTPEAIRKALVWRAYNKTTYMFRGDKEVDYQGILNGRLTKLE